MVIVHAVSTYPPYRGGMGNVARALVERTQARGHDVRAVTPAGERWRVRYGNAAWCPGMRHTIEQLQPDIVHLHWPFIGGVRPVLSWRLHDGAQRRRLIVQYHMDLIAGGWRGMLFRQYERSTLPWVLRFADRVVVTSLDYARGGALVPHIATLGDRLAEIPLGVDTGRFHEYKKQETGNGEPPILLFVGGLDRAHAFKGVPVLLEALARTPGVQLRIVGDGDLRASFAARAQALGIADRVTFLGAVSDDTLPGVYQQADVVVLPSVSRSEAFGLVLLEGMASGKPCIASDLPGVRTVVRDGETGWLVPPGDAAALADRLAWIVTHRDAVRVMGERAAALVAQRYDWERITDQWVALYQRV
ncbi:MAG: glycosyltransferase family 4 protein [bacterium]|nr:glycosyltransferase family 4 protein [bacterium]